MITYEDRILEVMEFVTRHLYIDVPAQVCTASDAVVVFYCVHYKGKEYRLPHRMFCSTVLEKAEKLTNLIIAGGKNDGSGA